jgi:hypothetical protein
VALVRNLRKEGPARTPRGTPLTGFFGNALHPGAAGWEGSTPGSAAPAAASPKKRFNISSLLPPSPLRRSKTATPFNEDEAKPRTLASRFGRMF